MGLYTKLHAIMCETESIEKNLEVGFGSNKYKAVGEASVLNAVKPLLKKHGIVLFPVKIEHEERIDVFNTSKGETTRPMTQIIATYKIVDIETGESELLQSIGNGVDTQDKASGKAMTYAYKALIQKTFMLFSGEDTDNEHSDAITDRNTVSREDLKAQAEADKLKRQPIEKANADALKMRVETLNRDLGKLLEYYKVKKVEDLTFEQWQHAMSMLSK